MGDSDITLYLSGLAGFVVVGAIVVFVIGWRVRKRSVRVAVGVSLLAVAGICGTLSLLAMLLVAALGIVALVLAGNTPRGDSVGTQRET